MIIPVIVLICLEQGLFSSCYECDTLAIIGTPMLLLVTRKYAINPKTFIDISICCENR